MGSKMRETAIKEIRFCLSLLDKPSQIKFYLFSVRLVLANFLDFAAIALISIIAIVATAGVDRHKPIGILGGIVSKPMNYLSENGSAIPLVLLLAGVFLIFRTFFSMTLLKHLHVFLAKESVIYSTKIIEKFFRSSFQTIKNTDSKRATYAILEGPYIAIGQVLPSAAIGFSEISTLTLVLFTLFVFYPMLAMFITVYFSLLYLGITKYTNMKLIMNSRLIQETLVHGNQRFQENVAMFRNIYLAGKFDDVISEFETSRNLASIAIADNHFLGSIHKYVYEGGLVLGAVLVSIIQFYWGDSGSTLAIAASFLAAASRVLPSLLRLQSSLASIKNSIGSIENLRYLIDHLDVESELPRETNEDIKRSRTIGELAVDRLQYRHSSLGNDLFSQLSFKLNMGESLGIVGASGVGKSTLIDLIIGLIQPTSGHVFVEGLEARTFVKNFPGFMSLVPQDVALSKGTVRENLLLNSDEMNVSDEFMWEKLEESQLANIFRAREGLDTQVGEDGIQLSGGQVQRLGIARALMSSPRILILDEATSALDMETERELNSAIYRLRDKLTLVVISHRVDTIRSLDRILFLSQEGTYQLDTFEELRKKSLEFETLTSSN